MTSADPQALRAARAVLDMIAPVTTATSPDDERFQQIAIGISTRELAGVLEEGGLDPLIAGVGLLAHWLVQIAARGTSDQPAVYRSDVLATVRELLADEEPPG